MENLRDMMDAFQAQDVQAAKFIELSKKVRHAQESDTVLLSQHLGFDPDRTLATPGRTTGVTRQIDGASGLPLYVTPSDLPFPTRFVHAHRTCLSDPAHM